MLIVNDEIWILAQQVREKKILDEDPCLSLPIALSFHFFSILFSPLLLRADTSWDRRLAACFLFPFAFSSPILVISLFLLSVDQ